MLHNCEYCGKPTKRLRFCSPRCWYDFRTHCYPVLCKQCGKLFQPQDIDAMFCSRECANISKRKAHTCPTCRKIFMSPKSDTRIFCSKQCKDTWMPLHRPIHCCQSCGKEFTTSRGHKSHPLHCSRACYLSDKHTKSLRYTCLHCGKSFASSNHGARFCSRACLNLYKGPTSIEIAVRYVLSESSVAFLEQYQLGEFVFDFLVPSSLLFIECDGTYWHSSQEARNRDRIKDKTAREKGYRVLRLSQDVIEKDINRCRDLIVNELR